MDHINPGVEQPRYDKSKDFIGLVNFIASEGRRGRVNRRKNSSNVINSRCHETIHNSHKT